METSAVRQWREGLWACCGHSAAGIAAGRLRQPGPSGHLAMELEGLPCLATCLVRGSSETFCTGVSRTEKPACLQGVLSAGSLGCWGYQKMDQGML
mmetsp:Transcript_76203/g.223393  ORF Transcript_76203/g.223393 Transcript_76203/m.223393 type:complete len:96 (-) Transcript_76203:1-288(-)